MSEVSEVRGVNPKRSLYFYETYICYRVCIYFTWYIVPVVQIVGREVRVYDSPKSIAK